MKITRIIIKSFLGIDHLDLAIEKPLILIAGGNAVGKTSIAHGIRYVLADDLCRVEHKKDIKALIREGAKLGSVSVWLKNSDSDTGTVFEYTRSAATGHFTKLQPPKPNPALPYLLDPPAFAEMEPNARLSFLYCLMGVNRSASSITKLLEERGHALVHIERIQTHLSGGFNAAHQHVKERITLLSGEWRGVTGENYGSVKAEAWACATPPEVAQSDINRLRTDAARCDAEMGRLQVRRGAIAGREKERKRLIESQSQTRRIAGGLEARTAAAQECQAKVDELTAYERELRENLEGAQAALTVEAHAVQGSFFQCPACGESLVYSRGECQVGKPAAVDVSAEIEAAQLHVTELKLALTEVGNRKRICDRQRVDGLNAVGQSQAAVEALEQVNQAAASDDEGGSDADIDDLFARARAQRDSALQALTALEAAAREYHEAGHNTRRATALHEEIKALAALAADLAPDGLPGELLSRAMRPINERLRDSAVMAGWSSVSITTNGILIHSRPWALASSSERWRANAMLAEAISYLSGVKCFFLDSADILEPSSRAQALTWLNEIAKDHNTIIIAMTLKQPPTGLQPETQIVWLGRNP